MGQRATSTGPEGASRRRDLLAAAHGRLRRLAAATLRDEFPPLRGRHDPDSVLHRAWPRLLRALETTGVESQTEVVRLAGRKVRQVLLDLVREHRRHDHAGLDGGGGVPGVEPPANPADDPSRLAELTELHEFVGRLPLRERVVFQLHYYRELSQAEIARLTGEHPREVSRLWVSAAGRVGRRLGGGGAS